MKIKKTQSQTIKKIFTSILIVFIAFTSLFSQAVPELLYYKFDGTGTSVPNLASAPPAGTTTATLMGGLSQGPTGQCQGAVIGSGNSSTTDYVNTGYATNLTGTSWTISMWTSNISASATLFYIFGDATAGSFRCFTNGVAGANNWILRGNGMTDVLVTGGATVAPHVTTFVYDTAAGNIKAYLDGVLVNTVAQASLSFISAGPFNVIGYSGNVGAPAGGLLDEFRMYNRALSDSEVALLANPPAQYSSFSVSNCVSYTVPSGNATYTTSGVYMDTIPSIAGCGADSIMTITLTINPLPTVSLGSDITQCGGTATFDAGNVGSTYLWSDASTSQTLTIGSSGTYAVTVTDANGCMNADTIMATINPLPTVLLGSDITQCGGTATLDAGNSGSSYFWNDGSTTQTISVSSSGMYYVDVTDANSCTGSDTVMVTINSLPTVTGAASSNTVCVNDAVVVLTGTPNGGTWSGPGVSGSSFTPMTAGTGTHTLTYSYTDANTCSNSATVTITVNACTGVEEQSLLDGVSVYPNPNNGLFTLAVNANVGDMKIVITDLQGRVVYSSNENNVNAGYVQQINLQAETAGIYFMQISANGKQRVDKISVQK